MLRGVAGLAGLAGHPWPGLAYPDKGMEGRKFDDNSVRRRRREEKEDARYGASHRLCDGQVSTSVTHTYSQIAKATDLFLSNDVTLLTR